MNSIAHIDQVVEAFKAGLISQGDAESILRESAAKQLINSPFSAVKDNPYAQAIADKEAAKWQKKDRAAFGVTEDAFKAVYKKKNDRTPLRAACGTLMEADRLDAHFPGCRACSSKLAADERLIVFSDGRAMILKDGRETSTREWCAMMEKTGPKETERNSRTQPVDCQYRKMWSVDGANWLRGQSPSAQYVREFEYRDGAAWKAEERKLSIFGDKVYALAIRQVPQTLAEFDAPMAQVPVIKRINAGKFTIEFDKPLSTAPTINGLDYWLSKPQQLLTKRPGYQGIANLGPAQPRCSLGPACKEHNPAATVAWVPSVDDYDLFGRPV
jgi:hypothetical protein